MIKLSGQTLTPGEVFRPASFALTLAERSSQAVITRGRGMPDLQVNDWLLDDEDPGAGIVWRVRIADDSFGAASYTLEHVIDTLRDVSMFGEVTPATITGTAGATTCTAEQAARYVLSQQSVWALGDFDFELSAPFSFNGEDLFSAMEKITGALEDACWEYDLTSLPFTLHIRQKNNAVGCEMRMGRNITSLRRTIDKTNMYTRIYPIGKRNLHLTEEYLSQNEAIWGRKDKVETDQSQETEQMLRLWALDRLRRHCEPTVTITIGGLDYSRATGEALDTLAINTVCRVPLPDFGTTVTERITKLAWRDKLKEPESVTVTLCNTRQDVASILTQQASGGGGAARAEAKDAEEDHAWFVDTSTKVAMVAEAIVGRYNDSVDWSRVSEIIVDGSGIHDQVVAAEGSLVTAFTRIDQDESLISLKVSKGSVATQLAVECGNVVISGGNLVVDGYVTAAGLAATTVTVGGLACTGDVDAQGVRASSILYGNVDLGNAVASFGQTSASQGTISIPYTRVDGTPGTINFNIADTQFYQDAVSAAYADGWAAARALISQSGNAIYGPPATVDGAAEQIYAITAGAASKSQVYWYAAGYAAHQYQGYAYINGSLVASTSVQTQVNALSA